MRRTIIASSLSFGIVVTLAACGPPPPPTLDRVRMDVQASGALSGLVQYKTDPVTNESSLIGLAEDGITAPEGVAFVVTLEPQSKDNDSSTDAYGKFLDCGDLVTATVDTGSDVVQFVPYDDTPQNRLFILSALKPGTARVTIVARGYGGSSVLGPITVVAQP